MRPLALLCLVLLSGCLQPVPEEPIDGGKPDAGSPDAGVDAGLPDAGPPEDGGVLYGVVHPDCAPWDGPAYRFQLSDQPLSCANSGSEGFYVSLWISPLSPASYRLGPDFSQQGDACLCGVVADAAQVGSLMTVQSVTDAGATGRIDATFKSGTQVHTRWEVIWCPGVVGFCG